MYVLVCCLVDILRFDVFFGVVVIGCSWCLVDGVVLFGDVKFVVLVGMYVCLLSLVDQVLFDELFLVFCMLVCVKIMGYNQIGQVCCISVDWLVVDFGFEYVDELLCVFYVFGFR